MKRNPESNQKPSLPTPVPSIPGHRTWIKAFLCLCFGLCNGNMSAQTVYAWQGGTSSDATNAANWDASGVPPFNTSANARISVLNGVNNPLIYSAAQGTSIFSANGGATSNRSLFIASGNTGAMEITGGVFDSRGLSQDGISNGSTGSLTINGGSYTNIGGGSSTFLVKFNGAGTGTLTVNTGSFTSGTLQYGEVVASSGTGIVNLNGGLLSVHRVIEAGGTANALDSTFNFNGGTLQARVSTADFMQNLNAAQVLVGGAIIDSQSNDITISQNLTGSVGDGGLTKQGSGTLVLGGTNTYTGATTVNGGILRATATGAIPTTIGVNSGGTFDANGLNWNAATRDVTIAGTGATGTVGALTNTAGGETSMRNVTLTGNATMGTNAGKLNVFGALNGGGNTLTIAGTGETNFRPGHSLANFSGITVATTGTGRLRFEGDVSPGSAVTATVNTGAILDSYALAATTRTMGANLTLNLNGGSLEANGGGDHRWNGPVTVSANSNVVANNRIDFFGAASGIGTITKTGGNVLVFRGGVTSLGGLNINAGRVRYEDTGFGTWTGPITVNSGGILSGYGNQNLTAAVNLNGGTLAVENNGTGTFAGTVTAVTNSTIDTAGGNITLNGTLTGSANLGKNGDGILLLNGSSTGFTGTLTMTNGSLRAANTNALPVNLAINSGATFDANGVNFGARDITIAGPGETGFVGAYTNTSGGEGWVRNITLSADATMGSSAGKINSNGAISGGGFTLTIAGGGETNFRGGTTFSNLAGITVATTGGGRLRFEGDIAPASLQTITVQSGGRLDTWSTRTMGANLNVHLNGGILESQGSGGATTAVWNGAFTLSGNPTINTSAGGGSNRNITIHGAIGGTGGFTKTGPGTLTLTNTNNYAGATIVNQGTLIVNGSLTGTSGVTVGNGGKLQGTGSIAGGLTVQSGGRFAPGNSIGTITQTGPVVFNGGATAEFEINNPLVNGLDHSPSAVVMNADTTFANPGLLTGASRVVVSAGPPPVYQNDVLIVDGATPTLTFDPGSTLEVLMLPNTAPTGLFSGLGWDLVTASSISIGGADGFWGVAGDFTYHGGNGLQFGDIIMNLPDLWNGGSSGYYNWNLSLFESQGIIVLVPEPGRSLLLLVAMLPWLLRRRRA